MTRDPRTGSDFLGYRIEALLGRGGMGVVYRAFDARLKRKVALKLIAPELSQHERFRERFLAETELAASLEHPNVVPIHDAGEVEGQLYLAMRYVEGSDLKTLLKQERPLGPPRAIAISAQVAAALDAAHAGGLVHRDVKPSNVLLDLREHVYLADFGLSRRLAEQAPGLEATHSLGTPAYVAPEQIQGEEVDARADVYSLGCLLYECLTGEVPFVRDSELAVLWGQMHESPPKASARNPNLSEAIDSVIARALAKNPEERYDTCCDLTEAAREALGLDEVVVLRDRRPVLLAVIGALVAAGALAAGLVLSLGNGGRPKASLAVTNNTLVRIDPETNRVAATTSVGRKLRMTVGAVSVAEGGNTVWVYNWDDSTVRAIDPRTAEVVRTVSIGGTPASTWVNPVAADPTGAWVLSSAGGSGVLTHVGLGFALPQQFPLGYDPLAVAVGERAVWVAAKSVSVDAVLRVSPITGAVLASLPLPGPSVTTGGPNPGFESIAAGGGAVWAARGRTVFRIDPATTRITGRVSLPVKQVLEVAAGKGGVWILVYGNAGNGLVRIDPLTLRVKTTISAPIVPGSQNESEASRLAVDRRAVWWIGADSGNVWRVDPRTGKIISTIGLTPPYHSPGDFLPFGIAAGPEGVWVTVTTAP